MRASILVKSYENLKKIERLIIQVLKRSLENIRANYSVGYQFFQHLIQNDQLFTKSIFVLNIIFGKILRKFEAQNMKTSNN